MKTALCLALCFVTLCLAGTVLGADDPTGTWKFTVERGGQQREVVLTLRLEAGKLTGHVPARNSTVSPIENGKYENGEISFSITRDINGVKRTSKYSGKLSADTITGKIESEREGKPVTTDWVAKKALQ
jgi:hypothetical protein